MKSLFIKLFIIFIYLISSSSAYSIEAPKIKNLILHKQPKKLENIEFQNINNKLMKLNDFKDKFLIVVPVNSLIKYFFILSEDN